MNMFMDHDRRDFQEINSRTISIPYCISYVEFIFRLRKNAIEVFARIYSVGYMFRKIRLIAQKISL